MAFGFRKTVTAVKKLDK